MHNRIEELKDIVLASNLMPRKEEKKTNPAVIVLAVLGAIAAVAAIAYAVYYLRTLMTSKTLTTLMKVMISKATNDRVI